MLVTEVNNFQKDWRYRVAGRLLGNGLVISSGDLWLRQRRLMQPAFLSRQVAAYGEDMVALTRAATDSWVDGEVRDIHADMVRLAMTILVKTIFGMELRGRGEAILPAFADALRAMEQMIVSLWVLPAWVPTPRNLKLRRKVAVVDRLLYELIQERRQQENGTDLLSVLIRARDEEEGSGMTDLQLRDEVMTLLIAGHETSALTLMYALHQLAEHPEAGRALREELATVMAGRPPTVADLPRLVYTERFVLEVLRLYPPFPHLSRVTVAATELGGYSLPAGTNVIVSPWVTQRDPRWFEDPEQFRPERWADGLAERLPRFAFFPFMGGPRVCIGQHFAMMEIVLALATIAQRYQFTRPEGASWRIGTGITLRPNGPVKLRVSCMRPDAGESNQAATQLPKSSVVSAKSCPVQQGTP